MGQKVLLSTRNLRLNVEGGHSGLAYVQTVCYLLGDAFLSVQAWLCVSWVGSFRGWYLALQCALDCFDPLELFPLIFFVLLRPTG